MFAGWLFVFSPFLLYKYKIKYFIICKFVIEF